MMKYTIFEITREYWSPIEESSGRKSFIGGLVNRKKNVQVAPDGVRKETVVDVQEFKCEMKRRGSFKV